MNRRMAVIKNTILERELGGSVKEWLFNTFSPPCEILSGSKIISIEEKDDLYYKIMLKGFERPLYLSKNLDKHVIQHVVSEQFYKWHWHYYEIPETRVQAGEVVFDCGSAEGIFSFLTYTRAKHVFAFEPLNDYCTGLEKTFKAIDNVTVVDKALGQKAGDVYLKKEGIASTVSEQPTDTKIKITTINDFCRDMNTPVNYIKADIEGYEQQMLNGAEDAIRKWKPKIAITVYHVENDVSAIIKQLKLLVPEYKIKLKGLTSTLDKPVMLHAWFKKTCV